MNIISSDVSVNLYLRHICIEIFGEDFQNDGDLKVVLVKENGEYSATATFAGYSSFATQKITFPSAKTCAVGKAIILLGMQMGYPSSPYGVLTGVRPVKIASGLIKTFGKDKCAELLEKEYFVKTEKISALIECADIDEQYRSCHNIKDVSLYFSIPFCPSRCNYCSFVSATTERQGGLISDYLQTLFFEMSEVGKIIDLNGLSVRSLYVGGGTPGILDEDQTYSLISQINSLFSLNSAVEFNFEIGRPETVTEKKLEILKNGGVSRISINTQSTDDSVLNTIGRRHTAKQYFDAVDLAQKIGFNSINTDLIAGLESDTFDTFKNSVDEVIQTGVDSITVHSLCLKKSARIKEDSGFSVYSKNVDKYIEYAKNNCISNGFLPYYLYRQKYSLGNHETLGYSRHKPSYYNIVMMNEIGNVIGMGAGATSRIAMKNKNLHFANYKYPHEYIRDTQKTIKELKDMNVSLNLLTGENS